MDYGAEDGTSRAWRTVNGSAPVETAYFLNALNYTVYVAYYANVGTAGAKTVGLSTPTGQQYTIAAIEVLATSSNNFTGTAPFTGSGTLTTTGVDRWNMQ